MLRRNFLLSCPLIIFGVATFPAAADVNVGIDIGIAPPPPRVEIVPGPRPGFIWASGYWRWEGRRHIWVKGHWMRARPGYYWVAERWEPRGGRHHFEPGHWEREGYREREREREHARGSKREYDRR